MSFSSNASSSGSGSPIFQPVTPCSQPSGHQPSRMLTFSTPFMAAFMPDVPDASSGRRGLLSHTSAPRRAHQLGHQRLAAGIARVRLAGVDDLRAAVAQHVLEPTLVAEDEIGAL